MTRILHIVPDFNYSSGVGRAVILLLRELNKNDNLSLFLLVNSGEYLSDLEELSVTVIKDELAKRRTSRFLIRDVLKLMWLCHINKIDVVHSHHRYPEFVAYLASKLLKIRTVSTVHSILSGFQKISFHSDCIIAVSNSVRKNLIDRFNIDPDKVRTLYNLLDTEQIENFPSQKNEVRKSLNFSEKEKVIFYAGRLCMQKGTDVIYNACKIISNKYSDIKLVLVGSIEEANIIPFKEVNTFCIILSERNNVYPFLTAADIIILPSREEALGYLMIEAGIFNKAFIGSKVGGIEEFIIDKKNGLLFERGNVEQLASQIDMLITNEKLAEYLANNLNKTILDKINNGLILTELAGIYNG